MTDGQDQMQAEANAQANDFFARRSNNPAPVVPSEEEILTLLRDTIKVDASGLAPAVVAHFIDGFDEAARAILALFAPVFAEKEREIAYWRGGFEDQRQQKAAALAQERERCAKVAEDYAEQHKAARSEFGSLERHTIAENDARRIAAAIRAGG